MCSRNKHTFYKYLHLRISELVIGESVNQNFDAYVYIYINMLQIIINSFNNV